ncbi:MAG: DNA polymerase III subunit delta [Firmicutes bacterium]|nr:DNA polymerase III subunit delta [Bacillota bacterium]
MKQLWHSLNMGLLCPVYLFYGQERLLLAEAVDKVCQIALPQKDEWSRQSFDGEQTGPEEIVDAANDVAFFGGKRVIIVKGVPWLGKKGGEGQEAALQVLLRYIADPNPASILILIAGDTVDKRRKLVTAIAKSGRVVEFPLQKAGERVKWLGDYCKRQGKTAERAALEYVSLHCAGGLQQLQLEGQKLLLYAADQPKITLAMAEETVSRSALAGAFDLSDAVAARQPAAARRIYRQMLQQGQAEQVILATLANHYRNILAVQDLLHQGKTVPDAAGILSIHPFVAEKCAAAAKRYSQKQLLKALDLLLAADIGQKTGQTNLRETLETALIRCCY